MMNDQNLRAEWVAALRSGKFTQTHGNLRDSFENETATHCCLGVLCELIPEGKWDGDRFVYGSQQNADLLPPILRHAIGISVDEQDILTEMNDTEMVSFIRIADWIEENL